MSITFLGWLSSLIWDRSDLHTLFENIVDGQEVPLKYKGELIGVVTLRKDPDGSIRVFGDVAKGPGEGRAMKDILNDLVKSGGFSLDLTSITKKENEQGGVNG